MASNLPHQRLGSFEILDRLGAGAMGEVYRARDTRLGREVAIKVLPEIFAQESDRLSRFEREARVLQLRFGLEDGRSRTLEAVGREFGVTRERIRQIEAKALRKLRHPTRSRKLKDFLE